MQLADIPNRRVEAWKYSDLRAVLSSNEDWLAGLATPGGVRPIAALARALATGETTHQFTVGDDGDMWTSVPHGNSGGATKSGRVTKIVAPVGSSGMIFERVSSWVDQNTEGGLRLSSEWTDIVVEDHATLTRVVVQDSWTDYRSAEIVQLNEATVRLGEGAKFHQFVLAEGAKLARIETHVAVEGEGADVQLNGVYLAAEGRHADLTSTVDHKVGGGQTRQLIKGAARKRGRGVFQGKIVVAPQAQKTDARQYHHGMLLEDGAEIFAKPELMIHADDVQCAHGNTAGGLDERALFYMRSRGLPEAQGRALLIESFLVEAIPEGLPAALNEELIGRIRAWLAGGAAPLGPPASSPADGGAASRIPLAGTPSVQEGRKP